MLVYLRKDDAQNSFVKKHQHGGYDVKCIRFIGNKYELLGYVLLRVLLCLRHCSTLVITQPLRPSPGPFSISNQCSSFNSLTAVVLPLSSKIVWR